MELTGYALDWYRPLQDAMRRDLKMRWLVDARNAVLKEGDLDIVSEALVSLALTGGEELLSRHPVPPLASPADVAARVRIEDLDEEVRKDAVLVVERRWTVPERPDDELLEILGHCYGKLALIVRKAHERCGVLMRTFGGESHDGEHQRTVHPTGRLPCMVATAAQRTAYWHLGENSAMAYDVYETILKRGDDVSDLVAHYGEAGDRMRRARFHPSMPADERARAMHAVAKEMLVVDHHHVTLAHLYRGDGPPELMGLDSVDQQDKTVKMRELAAHVDRHAIDCVIFTGEVWHAPALDSSLPQSRLRAGEREDRSEALVTYLLRPGQPVILEITPFTRDEQGEGGVVLGKTTESELDDAPFFRPVLKVWSGWATVGDGDDSIAR